MFEQIKNEWENGKKIYIFEIVSIIGFVLFLMVSDKLPLLMTTMLGNYISLGWILLNILVVLIYVVYEFAKVLMKEKIVRGNIVREVLIRILFFIGLFMTNIFPITMLMMLAGAKIGIDMSVPFFAMSIGLFIICVARKSIPSSKALTVLGVAWFITSFMVVFFAYPLLYAALTALVKQEMVASTILSIALFSGGLGIFYQVVKRVKRVLTDK
nr:hypothetical protein [uncultured Niameybacter sp.]